MSTLSKRSLVLLVLGVVVLAVVAFALIKRDAIGDLLLKGGDTSLTASPPKAVRKPSSLWTSFRRSAPPT